MPVQIILADDHVILREGLKALILQQPDLEVVGEASTGQDVLKLIEQFHAHVVIMDISMPGMSGLEATRQILKLRPACKVVALSGHTEGDTVRDMLKAGASAYVVKCTACADLVRAIRTVLEDKKYLSTEIAGTVVDDYLHLTTASAPASVASLSPREQEVLQLLAGGHNSREIGTILGVSPRTAEGVRSKIMLKLNLHSVADLTKYAIQEGLTSLQL
jgi:DNA-binding NarL/FixJ family response regulator